MSTAVKDSLHPFEAAKKAGLKKTRTLHGIRITAADKPGLGAKLAKQLAEAGINLRGFSGAAIGKRAIFHLAFGSAAEAGKAIRQLKAISSKL